MNEDLSGEEKFNNLLWGELEEPLDFPENEDDEPEDGGVREPRKPILPILPGEIEIELEREFEEENDLCILSN